MTAIYKLDKSNRQGWNCPPFANRLDWANFWPMGIAINMESIRAGLARGGEKKLDTTNISIDQLEASN